MIAWFRNNSHRVSWSMNALYREIGLSKQAVHQHFDRQTAFDEKLTELLHQVDILRAAHGGCGVKKMYRTLKPDFIGRDRFVAILMAAGYGLKPKKNYIKTTIPASYKYPNLIEGSLVFGVNQVWQSDITYVWVGGKYFYVVFIVDVYSRRILGYTASDNLRAEANLKALKQAINLRRGTSLEGLIHHSDRGTQYVAKRYRKELQKAHIVASMGGSGMENAYAERINGTIKNEYLAYWPMKTLRDLKRALAKAVRHYNNQRIHDHLPHSMSPVTFEKYIEQKPDIAKKHPYLIYSNENKECHQGGKPVKLKIAEDLGLHSCPMYQETDLLT